MVFFILNPLKMSQSKDSAPEFMINVYNMKKSIDKPASALLHKSSHELQNSKHFFHTNDPQLKKPQFSNKVSMGESIEKIPKNKEKPSLKKENNILKSPPPANAKKKIQSAHQKSQSSKNLTINPFHIYI